MKCAFIGLSIFHQLQNKSRLFENSSIGIENSSLGIDIGIYNHRLIGNDSIPLNIEHVWAEHHHYLSITHIILAFFLIFSNSAVIMGLIKTKRSNEIKIPQKLFILSAVCGLLSGVSLPLAFFAPMFIVDVCMFEGILEMMYGIVLMCEAQFMITLSITRLISVKRPFFEIKWKNVRLVIIGEIALSVLIGVSMVFFSGNEFFMWVLQGVFSFLWLILMLVLALISVFIVLTRSNRSLSGNMKASNRLDYNRRWKPIIRIATIQIAYILCNLPLTVSSLTFILTTPSGLQEMSLEEITRHEIITIWMYALVDFNHGLNACLYMAQCNGIRQYFYHFLTCGRRGIKSNQHTIYYAGSRSIKTKASATQEQNGKKN